MDYNTVYNKSVINQGNQSWTIKNTHKKTHKKVTIIYKSSNIGLHNKIEARPQGVRKNMGQGIERMPKVHRRQPQEATGRTADQPVPLSPLYKADSIIVRWRKFDTLM